jgi:hypothetical protein
MKNPVVGFDVHPKDAVVLIVLELPLPAGVCPARRVALRAGALVLSD